MKLHTLVSIIVVLGGSLFFPSCGEQAVEPPQEDPIRTAYVNGTVHDRTTTLPLGNATVTLNVPAAQFEQSRTTGADGRFNFSVVVSDTLPTAGILAVASSGYHDTSTTLELRAGLANAKSVTIHLARDTTTIIGGGAGGYANTISLLSVSQPNIAVSGVGGTETSALLFEVRDSLGNPISSDRSVLVHFSIISGPGGGEYASPDTARTNAAGRVGTTINSGTRSGPVQILARADVIVNGVVVRTIQTTPTRINIHGGLPHQNYFGIGLTRLNTAALHIIGATNGVLVIVGDRYSNPVAPGTAVYFSTTGGIVTASSLTGATGQATATLTSLGGSQPPNHPVFGPGYLFVRAETIGEGGQSVRDSILTLFSGQPRITYCIADTLNCQPEICFQPRFERNVYLQISDQNGNPLAAGTSITASVLQVVADSLVVIETRGLPSDPLDDYLFPNPFYGGGPTKYIMTVYDATPNGATSSVNFTVRIRVTGPNGTATVDLPGRIGSFCP